VAILAVAIRTIAAPARSGPPDLPELEAFLDGVMAAHLAAYSIPGVVVAVVKDGQRFAKGYGYADHGTSSYPTERGGHERAGGGGQQVYSVVGHPPVLALHARSQQAVEQHRSRPCHPDRP
jgi:hypothetical protein